MFARKNTLSLLKPDASSAGSSPPIDRTKRDRIRVSSRNSPSDAPSTLPNASATRNVSSCLSEYAPMAPRTCTSGWDSLSGMIFGRELAIDAQVVRRHHPGRETALESAPDLRAIEHPDPGDRRDRLVFGADDEAGDPMLDHLSHRAAVPCDDGRPTRHRLDHHQSEGLGPVDREEQRTRASEKLALRPIVDLSYELDMRGLRQKRLHLRVKIHRIGIVHLRADAQRHPD